jgi:hypothetical protein
MYVISIDTYLQQVGIIASSKSQLYNIQRNKSVLPRKTTNRKKKT